MKKNLLLASALLVFGVQSALCEVPPVAGQQKQAVLGLASASPDVREQCMKQVMMKYVGEVTQKCTDTFKENYGYEERLFEPVKEARAGEIPNLWAMNRSSKLIHQMYEDYYACAQNGGVWGKSH